MVVIVSSCTTSLNELENNSTQKKPIKFIGIDDPKEIVLPPCSSLNVTKKFEYYIFDVQDQVARKVPGNFPWFQAHDFENFPQGVNPFENNTIAFSYGNITMMSNNAVTDPGGCFRVKFANNVPLPVHIELGFWNHQTNTFSKYIPYYNTCMDYDTDCCWDNSDTSFYFFTQQDYFIDFNDIRDNQSEVFCFKIYY